MIKTKYNLEKIKKLSKFEDILNKKLKDPKFKQRFILATKKLELAHEIMMKRKEAKITQNELAKQLKTSQSFIAKVESGSQNVTTDVLFKIANAISAKQKKPVKFELVGSC